MRKFIDPKKVAAPIKILSIILINIAKKEFEKPLVIKINLKKLKFKIK